MNNILRVGLLSLVLVLATGCSSDRGNTPELTTGPTNEATTGTTTEATTGATTGGTTDPTTGSTDAIPVSDSSKPNILFIISDDQGLDASAQYSVSSDLPNTPVIDALANRGLVFDNAWATPSCTTTRGSLITGQHGINSGVTTTPFLLDPNSMTLQRYLANGDSSNSYASAVIGKWHLAGGNTQNQLSHPNDVGVDYYAGNISGTLSSYTSWPLLINGVETQSDTYHTTAVTSLAIDWIQEQSAPWFMWLAYVSPHSPFHLPPIGLHTQNLSGDATDIVNNPRPYYLAAIEAMDTEIGRLLDSLSTEELDNTLIIFVGDNGTPRAVIDTASYESSHGKNSLYEGGIRVPMVVAGKGVSRQNEREKALVNTVDFYATVAEAAGLGEPAETDSMSFYGLLSDDSSPTRDHNYSEFVGTSVDGWTVRNEDYKLMVLADGSREFYRLDIDPREVSNLINQTSLYGDQIDSLAAVGLQIRSETNTSVPSGPIDITGSILVDQSINCDAYVNDYTSSANDVFNNQFFNGDLNISVDNSHCVLTTNAIPNHDFNDSGSSFPNTVSAQNVEYRIPISPVIASSVTPLSLSVDNAIMLNGVKVDILAAGCFGVGNGKIGCNDNDQAWRYDPANPSGGFNIDSHNAHTQPDGTYHYHGEPNALFSSDDVIESPVVGFAADGFPIFGSYIDDGSTIRAVQSSYRLKSGARPTGNGQPGGTYDGTYRDDYEYVDGLGDLDQCNGMSVGGNYRYHITAAYPYVLACYAGTPDESFSKSSNR